MADNSAHSFTEGYEIDVAAGCRPNTCHWPNCQCSAPPKATEPGSLPRQLDFVSGMRQLLTRDPKAQVIIDADNLPLIHAIEQSLNRLAV